MTIKKWNDKNTIINSEPRADILISKGNPRTGSGKHTKPGHDLKDQYRLEVNNQFLRKRLLRIYRERGDFIEEKTLNTVLQNKKTGATKNLSKTFVYVDKLNIICAYEDWEKTFQTAMVLKNNKQQPLTKCDREKIYQERYEYKDTFGGNRYGWRECNQPCAADKDNIFAPCPQGCKPQGIFYCYLWELLDAGNFLCRLNSQSITDIIDFPRQLWSIKQEYGTIKFLSNYSLGDFLNYLPLVLTRFEVNITRPVTETKFVDQKRVYVRTGETSKSTTYKLLVNVNPQWKQAYNAAQKIERLQLMGQQASPTLIGQIVDQKDFVPGAYSPQLPAAVQTINDDTELDAVVVSSEPQWQIDRDKILYLRSLWQDNSWTESALAELLYSYFELSDRQHLVSLNQQQYGQLISLLQNPEVKNTFTNV